MDHSIGFGTWTRMLLDRLQKVAGSSVVEKKHALAVSGELLFRQ